MTEQNIFGDLYQDTEQNIDSMAKGPLEVASKLDILSEEAEKISKIEDNIERAKQEKILKSNYDTLDEDISTDHKSMNKAVYGMQMLFKGVNDEFNSLIEFSASEQSNIDKATKASKLAEVAAMNAETKINTEENTNGYFGLNWFKQGRIDNAETAKKEADIKFTRSKSNLERAIQKAEDMKRERLMNADIKDTLNLIRVVGQKTVDIMDNRIISLTNSLDAIKVRKGKAQEIQIEAVSRIETLNEEIENVESELVSEQLALDGFDIENQAKEHYAQQEKISNITANLEEIRGKLKVATTVRDEKTKSIKMHEVFQLGQQKLLSNHNMWIATLKSKLQEDLVKDEAYLEMLRGAADEKSAQIVDTLADEKNARQMEMAAQIIVASDAAYLEKKKANPEQMRRLDKVKEALAEHKANISVEEEELRQEMIKNYGMDPLKSYESFYEKVETIIDNNTNDVITPVEKPTVSVNESEDLFG